MNRIKSLIGKGFTKTLIGKLSYKLFDLLKPNYVNIFGGRLFIQKKQDIQSTSLVLFKEYEPNQTNLIKSIVKKGDTVIDIGANIGYYTLLMSKLVGKEGKVISFEPEENNLKLLRKTISTNKLKNVELIEGVANNKDGIVQLSISKHNKGGHNLLGVDELKKIKVNSHKIDNLLNGEKPSFVKIDVEGAEQFVLDGGKKVFKGSKLIIENGHKLKRKYNLDIYSFDIYDNLIEDKKHGII